jgi:uncharacterized protein YsxB (DUF464 family)
MNAVSAKAIVMAAALDAECNIKECINCNEEFIRYAIEKCREIKRG